LSEDEDFLGDSEKRVRKSVVSGLVKWFSGIGLAFSAVVLLVGNQIIQHTVSNRVETEVDKEIQSSKAKLDGALEDYRLGMADLKVKREEVEKQLAELKTKQHEAEEELAELKAQSGLLSESAVQVVELLKKTDLSAELKRVQFDLHRIRTLTLTAKVILPNSQAELLSRLPRELELGIDFLGPRGEAIAEFQSSLLAFEKLFDGSISLRFALDLFPEYQDKLIGNQIDRLSPVETIVLESGFIPFPVTLEQSDASEAFRALFNSISLVEVEVRLNDIRVLAFGQKAPMSFDWFDSPPPGQEKVVYRAIAKGIFKDLRACYEAQLASPALKDGKDDLPRCGLPSEGTGLDVPTSPTMQSLGNPDRKR
jgi:hypothetical protein